MSLTILELELQEPDNYEATLRDTDMLLAELLIKHYFAKNDFIKLGQYAKLTDTQEKAKQEGIV